MYIKEKASNNINETLDLKKNVGRKFQMKKMKKIKRKAFHPTITRRTHLKMA